jgi:hypothetical protein
MHRGLIPTTRGWYHDNSRVQQGIRGAVYVDRPRNVVRMQKRHGHGRNWRCRVNGHGSHLPTEQTGESDVMRHGGRRSDIICGKNGIGVRNSIFIGAGIKGVGNSTSKTEKTLGNKYAQSRLPETAFFGETHQTMRRGKTHF